MERSEFIDWLSENKINISGKYKGKRWGSVTEKNGDFLVRVCVQYDDILDEFLVNNLTVDQILVKKQNECIPCGRCIDGKCAFTGFDVLNPNKEQIEVIKKMILFRIEAIKEERIPNCSYIKLSMRGKPIEPCAVHKVCNPKCKAMKKY